MEPGSFSFWFIVVLISELFAIWLIWKLWRSDDYVFFKVSLSILVLIPVVGPMLVLWIGNFPPIQLSALQDRGRKTTDVYDRWRDVLEEKNPVRRFRKWREVMERNREDL